MKHAILIMAHKEIGHLFRLIEYFNRDCDVFIHIDKKSEISKEDIYRLKTFEQVKGVYKKFGVYWGGFSILKCEMFMLKEALRRCNADYIHLISGQDYPTRSLDTFLDFFERNAGVDFIQYVHLPHPRWENNTFTRFQYFYPYDWIVRGKNARKFVKRFVDFQKRHSLKRRVPDCFEHLYGNSQWFSITRGSAELLLEYTHKHPALYWRMMMTFAPEESYISTVIVNLKKREKVFPWNCRYIRWRYENGNSPANLGVEHFRYLLEKEYLFARKFETPYGDGLRRLIDQYLIYDDSNVCTLTNGGWKYDGFLKYGYNEVFDRVIVQLCRNINALHVLDMGCGSGIYVASLRSQGIAAAGYDANPYVEKLSALLLPSGEEPCMQADLTDDLIINECFDLVICKDVLPYIPEKYVYKAVHNLAKLSSSHILINWIDCVEKVDDTVFCRDEERVVEMFGACGFRLVKGYTQSIREKIKDCVENKYYLFEKDENEK